MNLKQIESLETLLSYAETQHIRRDSEGSKKLSHMLSLKLNTTRDPKPLKVWYSGLRHFVSDSLQMVSTSRFKINSNLQS